MSEPLVRRATEADLPTIATINAATFTGNRNDPESALAMVRARFASHPIYHYFVVEREGMVAGYIGWEVHGGLRRSNPAIELEQLAIDPESKGQSLGDNLVELSMAEMIRWMQNTNTRIESSINLFVWCYALNLPALGLYSKLFPEVCGYRVVYGDRAETMLRRQIPWRRSARDSEGKGLGD